MYIIAFGIKWELKDAVSCLSNIDEFYSLSVKVHRGWCRKFTCDSFKSS